MVSNSNRLQKGQSVKPESPVSETRLKLREIVDRYGLRNKKIRYLTKKERDVLALNLYKTRPDLDNE